MYANVSTRKLLDIEQDLMEWVLIDLGHIVSGDAPKLR